jgi:ABC-type Mn2+/Zn2+ transport system ATPase subunit
MKIVYLGRKSQRKNPPPKIEGDAIELFENNWDDFGHKTTFGTTCRIEGEDIELGYIKILVDGIKAIAPYLDKLLKEGWSGEFPIPSSNYISVAAEITFYQQLNVLLGSKKAKRVAGLLRDASYLTRVVEDEKALALIDTDGFRVSLQRERGEVKSFVDGWTVFTDETTKIADLNFKFVDVFGDISILGLKFQDKGLLPHEVNVLIGANGAGKSQALHQIVKDWLQEEEKDQEVGFTQKPNFSQIVVVSYSPFERFPVDLSGYKLQDKDAYKYFGFRDRSEARADNASGKIRLTHEAPKKNSSISLISCLHDDQRYRALDDWAQKLRTAEKVLRSAFSFDYAAVSVNPRKDSSIYYKDGKRRDSSHVDVEEGTGIKRFIPISSELASKLNVKALNDNAIVADGVTFLQDNKIVKLSSGQRLFSFIVINILGAMRRDSLILIDEPELFLHPNLEIQFIDMLKEILKKFNSKALLATHSVVTVREVPAHCVHVFERAEDRLVIKNPPFQTFGGDVQRITSYVFGDQAVSKPFEKWIKDKLSQYESAEDLINDLGNELNEELIIQIRSMGI